MLLRLRPTTAGARSPRHDATIMRRRYSGARDSPAELLWKFRGVVAVVSVPIFLFLAVLLLMPRAADDSLDFSSNAMDRDARLSQAYGSADSPRTYPAARDVHVESRDAVDVDPREGDLGVARPIGGNVLPSPPSTVVEPPSKVVSASSPTANNAAADDDARKYAIVFDAGSTGSRVHVYRFDETEDGSLALVDDTFEQLKPGLSSFAKNPSEGADSIDPLLEIAMKTVPEARRATTTVELRATAGLRLLPGKEADGLLDAVRAKLKGYPFSFNDDSVSIMDGAEEGAFQWLTMNYLLGNLDGDLSDTVATVDLGGGSVQLAYAAEEKHVKAAPEGYFKAMTSGSKKYHVYVYSHLGFGIMAARAAVLGSANGAPSPCVPTGHSGTYEYGGKTHNVTGGSTPANATECKRVVNGVLAPDTKCGKVVRQTDCSFNGAWDGSRGPGTGKFYLSSYLFDRVTQAGLVDPGEPSGTTTPGEILKVAEKACEMTVDKVAVEYKDVDAKDAPYYCHDLSYAHSLLTVGYKIHDEDVVTLVKQVEYNGQLTEAAWPLGAAINALSN